MSRPSIWHQNHPSLTSTGHGNTSSLHTSSAAANTASTNAATNALQVRINAKRAELENLRQLRDLSAMLATQMSVLEQKLSTLRDGTEAVAHVLANWDNVLNVVGMAGAGAANLIDRSYKGGDDDQENDINSSHPNQTQAPRVLPETLVRIPVQNQDEITNKESTANTTSEARVT